MKKIVGFATIVLTIIVLVVFEMARANQNLFKSAQNKQEESQVQNQDVVPPVISPAPVGAAKPTAYPTKKPTSSSTPTSTPKTTASPTPSVTYTSGPVGSPMTTTPTPSPTPTPDIQPPIFQSMTGPGDGTTISFTSFCFPMYITDNVSVIATGLMVRYSFDNSGVSEWKQDFAPCYQNVSDGFHTFVVQARDGAGNTTDYVTRSFTVQATQ